MTEPVKKHMHLVRVWQLNDNGRRMWPAADFESENVHDVPALQSQAEAEVKRLTKLMRNTKFDIEVSESDVTFGFMKLRIGNDGEE